jgi:hypothetical protein
MRNLSFLNETCPHHGDLAHDFSGNSGGPCCGLFAAEVLIGRQYGGGSQGKARRKHAILDAISAVFAVAALSLSNP